VAIVIKSASRANGHCTKLPTNRQQAGVELADNDGNQRNTAAGAEVESSTRSPTGIRSAPDACAHIIGYEQLSKLGIGFYPIHRDRSPAVKGKLDRASTIDLIKIGYWVEHRGHHSFALRILAGSRLLVIDTESPSKHAGKPGPDGELTFYDVLEEHGIVLPPCPTVLTATGGFHRYFLVPKWLPVRSTIGLWPGVDILAAGSSVILPGSYTNSGEYKVLRSFEECPIPEAPVAFITLIRETQKMMRRDRSHLSPSQPVPVGDSSFVSPQQWYRLFKNRVFAALWSRTAKLGDNSDSAYEYHLAKACFCSGLDQTQVVTVIGAWRRKHGLRRGRDKLCNVIIPAAWKEVSAWVDRWRAGRAAAEETRQTRKTASRILAFVGSAKTPQTPASIATALGIPRERAKKAMQRLAKKAQLLRTKEGYLVNADVVVTH